MPQPKPVTQYFTFGLGHFPLAKFYVIVQARTKAACRELMVQAFGSRFSFQYDTEEKINPKGWGLSPLYITEGENYAPFIGEENT